MEIVLVVSVRVTMGEERERKVGQVEGLQHPLADDERVVER